MKVSRRGFLFSVGASLGLSGCAATFQPMGPVLREAQFLGGSMQMADGVRLPFRVWSPQMGAIRAVIVGLHGFNDYSNCFDSPARALASHGIATYAFDQRGFGAAPHTGIWPGKETLVADAVTAVRLIRALHPKAPLYLMGESMGGAIALLALTAPDPAPVDGAILVSAAVWGFPTMGFLPRTALRLAYATMPGVVLEPPRGLDIHASDNIPMLRAMGRDPLVIKGARVDTMYGLTETMGAALDSINRVTVPTLALYGAHEEVLPPRPVAEAIQGFLHRPNARVAVYPNGYHMLLRDLQASVVVEDVKRWLDDHGAPLPSGAERTPGGPVATS